MTDEDKLLLLKDLSARLPYNVRIRHYVNDIDFYSNPLMTYDIDQLKNNKAIIKPYLRPISSMTEEEKNEYRLKQTNYEFGYFDTYASIDYLNAHHFDIRGLIPKGLAIEVTDENNPYK